MYKQIGNAVPVLLGKKIAEAIKNELTIYENKINQKKGKQNQNQKEKENAKFKTDRKDRVQVSQ